MSQENFYITTTLPYVNGLPHIGHTSEFIKADVIARFQRQVRGTGKVWFNVGTDEHGLKNFKKAQELGKDVKEYVDELVVGFKDFCELFQISYDTFYRTSEAYHVSPAQRFWNQCAANGDIYKKKYAGWYDVKSEEFKTDREIEEMEQGNSDTKNAVRKEDLIWVEEENYFFKLSKYRDHLLQWLDTHPEILKPKKRFHELRNWIAEMDDISISRSKDNLKWGVDVPDDAAQVMYVWFDALTNYVNVLGYGKDDPDTDHTDWWPGVQIFGVDNLRFQGAIWQGMLASAGLPQTQKLLCNGFVLAEDGTKMSKSVGNVVSPFGQAEKYGVEAVRFYIIAGMPTYTDAAYKEDELVNIYNAYLANNFGNLLNRVIHLANKKDVEINNQLTVDDSFKEKVDTIAQEVVSLYESFELQKAAQKVNELATWGNEYISEEEPWAKEKSVEKVATVLNNLSYLLQAVIVGYAPIIPDFCSHAERMLEKRETGVLFEKIDASVYNER